MSYSKQEYHMIWGARQLTLDDVLHALSLSFWHFINTIAYRIGQILAFIRTHDLLFDAL